jgi:hypothetical protein
LKDLCSAVHLGLACLITALVAIHIAAALKHLFVNRDGVFQRMLPHMILMMPFFFRLQRTPRAPLTQRPRPKRPPSR